MVARGITIATMSLPSNRRRPVISYIMSVRTLLLLNGVIEAGLGIFLMSQPSLFCDGLGCASIEHQSMLMASRMYGVAAFAIGVLSTSMSFSVERSHSFLNVIVAFSIFHMTMAIFQYNDNPATIMGTLYHGVIGGLFLAVFVSFLRSRTLINGSHNQQSE
jgi:hypothetical protein